MGLSNGFKIYDSHTCLLMYSSENLISHQIFDGGVSVIQILYKTQIIACSGSEKNSKLKKDTVNSFRFSYLIYIRKRP